MSDRYDDKPHWPSLFDPVDIPYGARDRERELSYLRDRLDNAVKGVMDLEGDLAVDEDGDLDYRTSQKFNLTISRCTAVVDEAHTHALSLNESFQQAVDEAERLADMLQDVLSYTGGVMISKDHDEVLTWARENLKGDWEYLIYDQNQHNPSRLKHIYILSDDIDRVNFKLRWF